MSRLALAAALLLALPTLAKAPQPKKSGSQSSKARKTTAERKLGCGFNLDLGKHRGLKAVSWNDFGTTQSARKNFVEKGPGKGGIRCAQTFKATEGATFHRLYDSGRTPQGAQKGGRAWTLEQYAAGNDYRKKMAVCTGWNDFAHSTVCVIKPGATAYVYVGPGESVSEATCSAAAGGHTPGEKYEVNAALQVIFATAPDAVCDYR